MSDQPPPPEPTPTKPAEAPPVAPAPAPPRPKLHREGLSRPETLAEKLGYAIEKWLIRLGLGLAIVAAICVVLIGVPLWRVARTEEVARARDFIERSEAIEQAVGAVESVGLPRRWRLEKGRASFTFPVRGSRGDGLVELVLEDAPPWADGTRSFRLVEGRVTDPTGRSWPIRGRRPR